MTDKPTERPTPMTDAEAYDYDEHCRNIVSAEFARALERHADALAKALLMLDQACDDVALKATEQALNDWKSYKTKGGG